MKNYWSTYLTWLIFVILWNFLFPGVEPIWDVVMAVILSYFSIQMKSLTNKLIIRKAMKIRTSRNYNSK